MTGPLPCAHRAWRTVLTGMAALALTTTALAQAPPTPTVVDGNPPSAPS